MSDETRTAPRRGWSSQDLEVIPAHDARYWSVHDAAVVCAPGEVAQKAEKKINSMIRLAGMTPAGKRYNGPRRRHVRVYRAVDLLDLVEKFSALTGGNACA